MVFFLALSLLGSLTVRPAIAQDEVPAPEPIAAAEPTTAEPAATDPLPAEEPAAAVVQEAPPAPTGTLEIRLTDANGVGLSGLFAVMDAAGAYAERWTEGGVALFPGLTAGTATISQLSGAADFAFDGATPRFIEVPAGGQAVLPIVNAFLDSDGDGVGDSVDICGAGSDAVDTDGDGVPDACDATPTGDDDADGVDNATDACPAGDDAIDSDADGTADACEEAPDSETPDGEAPEEPVTVETSTVVAEVAPEPVVVEGATVTCDLLAGLTPTIAADLAAYAPGAVVILTGAGWAPGQVVQIDVQATEGEWSLAAAMTAGHTGGFSYQFTLPEEGATEYRVVATGQCAAPEETSEIVAEVAAEPEVVAEAPVTCQQADAVAPWILTDLADYPPGARVTLTGGNWVAGQTIEILVEDDGIADAERGPWSHTATVEADEQGGFTYQFDLAPWFVADYSVVATGECKEAKTTFTDALVLSASLSPTQVPANTPLQFSMTVTNNNTQGDATSSASNLGCILVTLPNQGANGVTAVTAGTVVAPDGKAWTATIAPSSANEHYLVATANNDASKLALNETVAIQFGASSPVNVTQKNIFVTGNTTRTAPCSENPRFNTITIGLNNVPASYTASATITPTSVPALTSRTYTVRVTNNGSGGALLGSAKILIPTGFTVPPSGISLSGASNWVTSYNSTDRKIQVNANNDTSRIGAGSFIDVTFTTTSPNTSGLRTFSVEAWEGITFAGNVFGFASQPSVNVTTVCPPTIGITAVNFGTSTWTGTSYPSLTAGLAIQISPIAAGCTSLASSWSLQASTSAMSSSGGGTIAATAINYTGTFSGSPPSGLTPSTAKPLGTSAQTIATGNSSTATGTWNAGLSLAPPATAPPGSYAGTITVTAATGAP